MQKELWVVLVLFAVYFELIVCIPKLSQGVNAKSQYGSAKSQTRKANSHLCTATITRRDCGFAMILCEFALTVCGARNIRAGICLK